MPLSVDGIGGGEAPLSEGFGEADLRFPIGKVEDQIFSSKDLFDEMLKQKYLQELALCPGYLENAILNLDEQQINTPYRDGGWSVQLLVHHVADSHMNAYVRFKLALTEDNPTIKPYDQDEWAKLYDSKNLPVNISLTLLHALHKRWVELMKNMSEEEWGRTLYHPEYKREIKLWDMLGSYAWHGKHHTAHITELRKRMGWN